MGTVRCPLCFSHNIEVISADKNYVVKGKTKIDLNPLHPFTLTKTKVKKKGTVSPTKLFLAVSTAGLSVPLTGGIRTKRHIDFFCKNCGHRWTGK